MCEPDADTRFGPAVGCGQFDFTLLFEQSVIAIGPAVLFLLLLPLQLKRLLKATRFQATKIQQWLDWLKLSVAVCNVALQIALLVLWCKHAPTETAIAAGGLGVASAVAISAMIVMQRSRIIRASTLLFVYLVASAVFFAILIRSLSIRGFSSTWIGLCGGILATQITLLALDLLPRSFLSRQSYGPEDLAGPLDQVFFWWLNKVLFQGFKANLHNISLPKLDAVLRSESLSTTSSFRKHRPLSLIFTVVSSLRWAILLPVIPRLALIGFTWAQPFLISAAVGYLERPEGEQNVNHAYGLIGATALIYLGIAFSTATYHHSINRLVTRVRGVIIALVYSKSLKTRKDEELASLTLMSVDTDRVVASLQLINELWARLVEIGLGIWLLWLKLGVAAVAPVVIVTVCFVSEILIAKHIGSYQGRWVSVVQERVAFTSVVLRAMRSLKLSNLTISVSQTLHDLRRTEILRAKPFRWFIVGLNVISNVPQLLSQLVVFAIVAADRSKHHQEPLSAADAFSALSIITLLTTPAAALLGSLPTIAAASGCLNRIGDFLDADEKCNPSPTSKSLHAETTEKQQTLEIVARPRSSDANQMCLSVRKGEVHAIIGGVGSGKSTLLRAILTKTSADEQHVMFGFSRLSYCAQTAWLPNDTIQNIVAGCATDIDDQLFNDVLRYCELINDLARLPAGVRTKVGSHGSNLSGGQKQRVALARALYSRSDLLLIDDIFSSIDLSTRRKIARNLFSEDGFTRRLGLTTVLVSSCKDVLRYADIHFDLEKPGPMSGRETEDHKKDDGISENESSYVTDTDESSGTRSEVTVQPEEQKEDPARRYGDKETWAYYARSIGAWRVVFTLTVIAVNVLASNFPKLLLNWSSNGILASTKTFVGIYATLAVVTYVSQGAMIFAVMIVVVPHSGLALHQALLDATMGAKMAFIDSVDTSTILNRFSQDMSLVDAVLPSVVFGVFLALLQCVMQAALISFGSYYMAATVPAVILALYCIQKYYLRTSRQMRLLDLEARSPLYQHFTETLEGIETIRAFGWQERFQQAALRHLDFSQKPYYLMLCIQRWLNLLLDLVVAALAVLLIALALCVEKSSDGGRLGIALTSILAFNQTLQELINEWTQAETSLGAIARTKSFERDTPQERDNRDCVEPSEEWPKGDLSISNMSAGYTDGHPAVQDVSLNIKAGQKVGIIGRTGSGKSTLVSLLFRLLDPSEGNIKVDGLDLSSISTTTIRDRMICLPQDPVVLPGSFCFNLDPNYTICDNATLITILERVDLWTLINERGGLDAKLNSDSLSHGQKQLFSFARVLVRKKKRPGACMLVMDEATSAMDEQAEERVLSLVDEEFGGCTVLSISHRTSAVKNSDVVVRLEKGRVAAIEAEAGS